MRQTEISISLCNGMSTKLVGKLAQDQTNNLTLDLEHMMWLPLKMLYTCIERVIFSFGRTISNCWQHNASIKEKKQCLSLISISIF